MDTHCIQELIYQSNPYSLNPIISYDECLMQSFDEFIQCAHFEPDPDSEHSSLEVHDSEDGRTWMSTCSDCECTHSSNCNSDGSHGTMESNGNMDRNDIRQVSDVTPRPRTPSIEYKDENTITEQDELIEMISSRLSDDDDEIERLPDLKCLTINLPIKPISTPCSLRTRVHTSDEEYSKSNTQSPSSKITDGDESIHSASTFMLIE